MTISHSETGNATGSAVASPGVAAVGRVSTSACSWQASRLAMSHEVTRPVTEAEVRRPRWRTVEVAIVIAVGCRRCSLVPGKQTSDRVKLSNPAGGERTPGGR